MSESGAIEIDLVLIEAEFELNIEPVTIELVSAPAEIILEPPDVTEIVLATLGEQGPPGPQGEPGTPGTPGQDGQDADLDVVRAEIDSAVDIHIDDPEPHPAYDDMQSLQLTFENALL